MRAQGIIIVSCNLHLNYDYNVYVLHVKLEFLSCIQYIRFIVDFTQFLQYQLPNLFYNLLTHFSIA